MAEKHFSKIKREPNVVVEQRKRSESFLAFSPPV